MDTNDENGPTIFEGRPDVFKGITIATDEQPQSWNSVEEFATILKDSLHHWQKTSVRGVWIKIPLKQAELVAVIAKHGFEYHHAQPDYVMMTRWLPEDEPNMLPGSASHYLGVGGLVLNERKEMLVIKELYKFGGKSHWKLPGGTVDPGEELPVAVTREVLEETGVSAEFVSIGCFRHMHGFRFGKSDIYFVCHMRALSSDIKPCPSEIAACRWMPVDEFLTSTEVHDMNKYFVKQSLQGLDSDRTVTFRPEIICTKQIYSNLPKENSCNSEAPSLLVDGET